MPAFTDPPGEKGEQGDGTRGKGNPFPVFPEDDFADGEEGKIHEKNPD